MATATDTAGRCQVGYELDLDTKTVTFFQIGGKTSSINAAEEVIQAICTQEKIENPLDWAWFDDTVYSAGPAGELILSKESTSIERVRVQSWSD